MFSYSYQPKRVPSLADQLGPETTNPSRESCALTRGGDECEGRTFDVLQEDLVTLDDLVGIAYARGDYSFVQYTPSEKHKRCAGMKSSPIHQTNVFVGTLRDKGVRIETALCTLMPSRKKSFFVRVSLVNLTELSLEPLWMIKGSAQLYSKRSMVTITINDLALERCFLDSQTLLLSQSDADYTERLLQTLESDLTDKGAEGKMGNGRRNEKRTMCIEKDAKSPREKRNLRACGGNVNRQRDTESPMKSSFNQEKKVSFKLRKRNLNRVHTSYSKTRDRALSARPASLSGQYATGLSPSAADLASRQSPIAREEVPVVPEPRPAECVQRDDANDPSVSVAAQAIAADCQLSPLSTVKQRLSLAGRPPNDLPRCDEHHKQPEGKDKTKGCVLM